MNRQLVSYLLRAIGARFDPRSYRCPSCGGRGREKVDSKGGIFTLRRCEACHMMFRVPTESKRRNFDFYQDEYKCGYTTDCPDAATLRDLKSRKFIGSERDMSIRIALLRSLGVKAGDRVLDFGASWGYGTWQFREAGLDVAGFEISRPRARYAREMLDLPVFDDLSALQGPFDVFFSSHVLEHVPSPAETWALAQRVLRPGGLMVAFTPNGSDQRRMADPRGYHTHWGRLHPNFLDDRFYQSLLRDRPKLLASNPYDMTAIAGWDRRSDLSLPLAGDELLLVTIA